MRYTTEWVLRVIDECHCDRCGALVRVGDRVTWELATGAGYCGPACAAAAEREDKPRGAARVAFYGADPAS